jgi:hypothetical protein
MVKTRSEGQELGVFVIKLATQKEFLCTLSKCRTLDVSDSCTLLLETVDPTLDMTCLNFPFLVNFGSSLQEL